MNLQKLRFRGQETADAIIHLQARGLREISGDYCRKINDATLSVIAARHEQLESLQLGPDFCEKITTDAIKAIAVCCPKLNKLRLSGVKDVHGDAIDALAKHCRNLTDLGFMDCLKVEELALGNILSLRFLSVAGTTNLKWGLISHLWGKLPNLTGLDVSRTDITPNAASRLFASSQSLKVLCALNCSALEQDVTFFATYNNNNNINNKGKLLLAQTRGCIFEWRNGKNKDKNLDMIMNWLEWSNPQGLDAFWLKQGAALLLSLMQSSQEDVQEKAATALATFVVIDDENASIDCGRAEAVMRDGGIRLLLNLARSWREGLQSEAAKAIANLSVNANVAKAVADEGGINILSSLARSMNRSVAEEAAGGLWNLSVGEEHKGAIMEAGGVKSLVDLIFKWSAGGDGVLERAAGALANLAADDKCSMEVALAGGVHALVMLARNCKFEGVQEQAARALANLAAHGDSNSNNAAVGQEAGALEALVLLTKSPHEGVRQEAAGALWNLSFDDETMKQLQLLVALAQSCSNASPGLQERLIAIGREGGVAPLIALARSDAEDVHETAAGALWNLAFNPGNALRIVEEGGVPALVHLCASSVSKMARFMAALALAYMFDGRMDEFALIGTSSESTSKSVSLDGARRMALKHIETFILTFSDPQSFSAAAVSSAPAALAQIGRFVAMLRNPSSILKSCAAFALLQLVFSSPLLFLKYDGCNVLVVVLHPGGRHAVHHATLLQSVGAARVLVVQLQQQLPQSKPKSLQESSLRNLEHHQMEQSI
ncbi:hypothetical protein AAG906_024629 [Vitis piasezkii]